MISSPDVKQAKAPYVELVWSYVVRPPKSGHGIPYGTLRSYCITRAEFARACTFAIEKGLVVEGLSQKEWRELQAL